MPKFQDRTGQRIGRLVAVGWEHDGELIRWNCLCDCGKAHSVLGCNFRRTLSCGCLKDERTAERHRQGKMAHRFHGHTRKKGTPEYRCWLNMRNRCKRPDARGWEHYGG